MEKSFERFVHGVTAWSYERELYDQSTLEDQMAYSLRELGEVLAATTDQERKMEVGDVAVCLVNCAHYADVRLYLPSERIGVKGKLADVGMYILNRAFSSAIIYLTFYCDRMGYDFEECCWMALEKIEKRKGEMIDGKFVRYENCPADVRKRIDARCGYELQI